MRQLVLAELTDEDRAEHSGDRPGGQKPPVNCAHHLGAEQIRQVCRHGRESAPAEISGFWVGDREGESDGYRGVNGIPAGGKDLRGGACGVFIGNRNRGRYREQSAGFTTLRRALAKIPELRDEFWKNVRVLGAEEELNQSLEKAGRVADFLELGELMCIDARHRRESCGGHFRIESHTSEGEAKRDDANFCYVAAWEYTGPGQAPTLHKEPLTFEHVHLAQRSYK